MKQPPPDDIPFDRTPLQPGRVETVAPGVRRLIAPNPGPFTFTGSCSYIVGSGEVAIIDPGPDDPAHINALLEATRGETVTPHLRQPHPPRPLRRRRAAQGRDPSRSAGGRPASGGAAAAHRRDQPARCRRRPRFPPRPRAGGRRAGDAARTGPSRPSHPRPHRQPPGVRLPGGRRAVHRRPHHGVVDLDRGAAGRGDERLHGLADASCAAGPRASICPATAPRRARRRGSWRATSATARAARPPSCTGCARARPTSPPWCGRSISASTRGCSAPPRCRCWRTWRTWWRAAWWPPRACRRSPDGIGWREIGSG